MLKKERYKQFIQYFQKHNPNPNTELKYKNAYQLLVATILSARCTDKRINIVTPNLFKAFPNPKSLSKRTFDEVFKFIKSVTFPNNKTKYLISMANTIMEKYNGKVPYDVEDLQKLAGVGRKTAHAIASTLHNEPTMVVDTHVNRVSKRIGLVEKSAKTPLAVEKELVKYIPPKYIPKMHHWLILHGRYICVARKPKCDVCPITKICLYLNS
ncbi:MAG: endonuclease III [Bacteroidetes bacterium]|nr:endonuclease III [Bacteroidota bacterium]